jgi:DNA-binding PadR family transcriptional regulator
MDMSQVTDWETLFGHKHAVPALLCLHAANGRPLRWTDVSNSMSQRLGTWIDSQAVRRALNALIQLELVEKVNSGDGNNRNRRYTLTRQGVEVAQQISDMFDRLDQQRGEQAG